MMRQNECQRSQRRWRRPLLVAAILCTLVFHAGLASAASNDPPTDPAWQATVEQIVERYIRTHPEVIAQTLQAAETRRRAKEQERVAATIAARQEELLHDPASPVSGNPSGEITVVEFFDYRCGFCKRAAGAVTQLQKTDPRVRVVYKDFPILGEASVLAATAALASQAQGRHQAFHEALLAAKGELAKEQVLHIAQEVGLDVKRLESDMENSDWQTVIERNHALAVDLGISGTPTFVVGTELHAGAVDFRTLKLLIARATHPIP